MHEVFCGGHKEVNGERVRNPVLGVCKNALGFSRRSICEHRGNLSPPDRPFSFVTLASCYMRKPSTISLIFFGILTLRNAIARYPSELLANLYSDHRKYSSRRRKASSYYHSRKAD